MTISDPGRGLVRRLGVTAAALFAFAAASQQRAEALSLASPGTAPSAKFATDGLTTEVQHGGGGGGFRGGGGGGFRGGGWRWVQRRRSGISWRRLPRWRRGLSRRWFQRWWDGDPPWRFSCGARLPWRRTPLRTSSRVPPASLRPSTPLRPPALLPSSILLRAGLLHVPGLLSIRARCRVIWTYYGPRKICRYRPWHAHYYARYGW